MCKQKKKCVNKEKVTKMCKQTEKKKKCVNREKSEGMKMVKK